MKTRATADIGSDGEFYVRVVRVGGLEKPTVQLDIDGVSCRKRSFRVASQELARQLAGRLYETVKVTGRATWDTDNLELVDLVVTELDEGWQDVHLASVIREHGRFPLEPKFDSLDELLRERREMRGNGQA